MQVCFDAWTPCVARACIYALTEMMQLQFFTTANLDRFYECHSNRQGIAVLAFDVESVDAIHSNYKALHPKLIWARNDYDSTKILEVFAYYSNSNDEGIKEADRGTILRFVERDHTDNTTSVLPGLIPVNAVFDQPSQPAYCDHWVSNVHSRTDFLSTLHDTLGFVPKVDFNAGVVAAGEAQIESTVTGNDTPAVLMDAENSSLRNQSQVYLPINNDLSQVGHVYGFLKEIGQGIQHVASRVANLVEFVQTANDWREMTGEGFSFLSIPRSYYGTLTTKQLVDAGLSSEFAATILELCENLQIMSIDGAVDLSMDENKVDRHLQSVLDGSPHYNEYMEKKERTIATILKSRYINLHSLLKNHIPESSYLGIVRNQILVDVQGEDLLYQIFTSNILQRNSGEEAPFLEFIQRVCSEEQKCSGCPVKIRPGCGGFGIRNFLTLFLSIELSKAMRDVKEAGDDAKLRAAAQAMVDCFTDQLTESNPILTEISDAMTRERHCHDMLLETKDAASKDMWREQLEISNQAKLNGNRKLMDCSNKYKNRMIALREGMAD